MSVEMLKITGNSLVADELELSTLNSIVGMHSSSGHWATYNTPMDGLRRASAHSIQFQAREGTSELNCCSVNAPRGFGILSDWALMKEKRCLILNYYGPSELTTKLKPGLSVTLTQETEYPADGKILIHVRPSKAGEFGLKLRVPQWSARTKVKLNGKTIPAVKAGSYLRIDRKWKAGDTIQLTLDLSLHLWQGEQECKGTTSIYRGPILLAYDHRYNSERAMKRKPKLRTKEGWDDAACLLDIPPIDARSMKPKRVQWSDWLQPLLLLEIKARNGETIRLCDFGSAGEAGTPYRSCLPVKHSPKAPEFSKEKPLRSTRMPS